VRNDVAHRTFYIEPNIRNAARGGMRRVL